MNISPITPLEAVLVGRIARPATSERGFSKVLMEARSSDECVPSHTVRDGETLWGICADRLAKPGGPVDATAVQQAVSQVARDNGLDNPNMIRIGQRIDLSALGDSLKRTSAARSETAGAGGPPAPTYAPHTPRLGANRVLKSEAASASAGVRGKRDITELLERVLSGKKPQMDQNKVVAVDEGGSWQGLLGGAASLSSGFGMRRDPFTGRRQHHSGIDLAAETGTDVHPLGEGTVTFSGWKSGYGRAIVVRHDDGTETVYGHLSRSLVKEGDKVAGRDAIGKVGSTGRSTGPHLHFEVRKRGRAIDPMKVLDASGEGVGMRLARAR